MVSSSNYSTSSRVDSTDITAILGLFSLRVFNYGSKRQNEEIGLPVRYRDWEIPLTEVSGFGDSSYRGIMVDSKNK